MRDDLLLLLHLDECRKVALAILVCFQGVGESSGHVILQLQKAHDLAGLRCTTAETAKTARSEPEDSWIGNCFKFNHFDIQSKNQDIWLRSERSLLLLPFTRACLNFSPR